MRKSRTGATHLPTPFHRHGALWVLALMLNLGCSAPPRAFESMATEAVTAFIDVNVVPMTGASALLRNQTVIVRGDRIVTVGPAGRTAVPRGARRIDGADRYLMPGLSDMHVHLEYFEDADVLKVFLANGVTTVRNMDGRPYILEWRDAVASGELLGPTIHTAGPVLDGDPPLLPDNTVVRNAGEARERVFEQAAARYDFVKVYTNLSAEAYRAVLRTAAERRLPVTGHVPRSVELDEVLAGGQVAIEHLADYADWLEAGDSPFRNAWHWSKLYLAMPVDTTRTVAAARRVAASGVWTVPTMIQADRALAPADSVRAWMRHAGMALISQEGRTFWEERNRRSTARLDDDDWLLVQQGRTNRARLVQALHAAGARLLVGTDTPNPFVMPGSSVLEELRNFVGAGMPPGEALVAATRDAARFLGAAEEWGTIEPGRRADLLLLQGNPLDDVQSVERRVGVMVRGRWLTETELRTMIAGLTLR